MSPSEPKTSTTAPQPTTAKRLYNFPNQTEGQPFSVEAASRQEAEAANATYLKSYKKENS